jgi:hypothetical protein
MAEQTALAHVDASSAPDLPALRRVVDECFPDLWPALEAALATAATLLLESNANPVALILNGSPSSGKTTVADMLADHVRCYRSDNFTIASFVSQAANRERKDLEKVDLLPRIRHRMLVTPELAPIFRGKEDELSQRFAILTRVLDGQGLLTDSGTHGQRGYRGDYLFAWLGCTTPFETKVWRVMAQLGSRLFFLLMDDQAEPTVEDLVALDEERPYRERLALCKTAAEQFLTDLFDAWGGVRGVTWDAHADPEPVRRQIARLATALAVMRSDPGRDGWVEVAPAKREVPLRAYAVLGNLARGRALVHGRRQLTQDDVPLVARVVVSSMPTERGRVFAALSRNEGVPLTVGEVQAALGVRHRETARRVMTELDGLGIMEFGKGPGDPSECLRFRPDWAWCAGPELAAALGPGVKIRGV